MMGDSIAVNRSSTPAGIGSTNSTCLAPMCLARRCSASRVTVSNSNARRQDVCARRIAGSTSLQRLRLRKRQSSNCAGRSRSYGFGHYFGLSEEEIQEIEDQYWSKRD